MKYCLIFLLMLASCSSSRSYVKKTHLKDIMKKSEIYGIKDNPYFYFMIDSLGQKHLVKMHMFNSDRIIWTEKLIKIK